MRNPVARVRAHVLVVTQIESSYPCNNFKIGSVR